MYSTLISLLVLDVLLYCPFDQSCDACKDCDWSPVEVALHALTAVVFLILSICYGLYGYRLYHRFAQLPSITSQRYQAHRRAVIMLGLITFLFTAFFLIRAIVVAAWLWKDFFQVPWFDPVYYFVFEVGRTTFHSIHFSASQFCNSFVILLYFF